MFRKAGRRALKQALFFARVKLVYTRLTLNRCTTFYFVLALVHCLILASLQAVSLKDNFQAVELLSDILVSANVQGFPIIENGVLHVCADIPGPKLDDSCIVINSTRGVAPSIRRSIALDVPSLVTDDSAQFWRRATRNMTASFDSQNQLKGVSVNSDNGTVFIDRECVMSIVWIEDVISDMKREDLVTLAFLLWLLVLTFVTILNESIPHLIAGLAGHVLNTAWAAFRLDFTRKLEAEYQSFIVAGPCNGVDVLGTWWDLRATHEIPIVIINVLSLLSVSYLSFRLFKVYAIQTFSRVGASPEIHRVYKLVLLFSVGLQLTVFFNLASSAIWMDKISRGAIRQVARHITVYQVAFAFRILLEGPWVALGWLSVRRESRRLFLGFAACSALSLLIASFMFASRLYRFIFNTWPFFATVSITSFVLLVSVVTMAIICRTQFGKGLAHYLQVQDVLDGVDFTPVTFSTDPEKILPFDPERDLPAETKKLTLNPSTPEKDHEEPPARPPRPPSLPPSIYMMSLSPDDPSALSMPGTAPGQPRLPQLPPGLSPPAGRPKLGLQTQRSPSAAVQDRLTSPKSSASVTETDRMLAHSSPESSPARSLSARASALASPGSVVGSPSRPNLNRSGSSLSSASPLNSSPRGRGLPANPRPIKPRTPSS